MEPLSEPELRTAFEGHSKDVFVPDLTKVEWHALDYFGWIHPGGNLGYIVLVSPLDGQLKGTLLRRSRLSNNHPGFELCSLCHHVHRPNGTAMFTASYSDEGKLHSVGNVVCKNLDCSLRIRNILEPESCMNETLYVEAKVWRMQLALHKWLKAANCL
ncbi:MAG TPA: FBP domain-containing protein [Pseudomonadales bacterium]|nr:FBP domain-containing protein [Pseudomonadales bacterium]